MKKGILSQTNFMYIGEMSLLITAVLVMTGLVKGITEKLHINDYIATFTIFLIVLLNVRGGIKLTRDFSLAIGGVLSLLVGFYVLIRRSEKASDILFALLSMAGAAGIAFVYTLHFSSTVRLDPRLLAVLLALLIGLWSAFAARRTFASCLFSATVGSFIGVTIWQIFFRKSGNIGGSYSFAVMWLGAIFGLGLQYLLTKMMRAIKSPRADVYFEAGELKEESDEKKNK